MRMCYNKIKEYFYRAIVNTFPPKIRWFLWIRPLSTVLGWHRTVPWEQEIFSLSADEPLPMDFLLFYPFFFLLFPYSSIHMVGWNHRNKFVVAEIKAQFGLQLLEIRKFIFRLSGKYLHFPWCWINELRALYVVGSFAAGKLHFVAYCTVHSANCRIWL